MCPDDFNVSRLKMAIVLRLVTGTIRSLSARVHANPKNLLYFINISTANMTDVAQVTPVVLMVIIFVNNLTKKG